MTLCSRLVGNEQGARRKGGQQGRVVISCKAVARDLGDSYCHMEKDKKGGVERGEMQRTVSEVVWDNTGQREQRSRKRDHSMLFLHVYIVHVCVRLEKKATQKYMKKKAIYTYVVAGGALAGQQGKNVLRTLAQHNG